MRIDVGEFHLSPYRSDDAPQLVEHLADGVVAQTIPVMPHPYGLAEAQSFLESTLTEQSQVGVTTLAIRSPDGLLCGAVGLGLSSDEPSAELGYWLAPRLWGRGVMGAAVPVVLEFAAGLSLRALTARAITTNYASLAILRRNGFSSLGIREGAARTSTGLHDFELFRRSLPVGAA